MNIKTVTYFGNGDGRAAKAGQAKGGNAEQCDQKNFLYVFHKCYVFDLGCCDLHSIPIGSGANLLLFAKAEIAVKTRQVFHRILVLDFGKLAASRAI